MEVGAVNGKCAHEAGAEGGLWAGHRLGGMQFQSMEMMGKDFCPNFIQRLLDGRNYNDRSPEPNGMKADFERSWKERIIIKIFFATA